MAGEAHQVTQRGNRRQRTFFGGADYRVYHLGGTARATGSSSFGNAWLATEAKRAQLAAGGIRVRLRECEQLKSDHPDWVACCCKG